MQTVEVAVQADHLERLTNTKPLLGLAELVWNGLDADARRVEVLLARNDLDGLERIIVRDDGHGMSHDEVLAEFSKLGGSWKSSATATRSGERVLHGSRGEGRFRAFALGRSITWSSVSERRGQKELVVVQGMRSSLRRFEIEDAASTQSPVGTHVEIDTGQETPQGLQGAAPAAYLSAQLALYLEKYPTIQVVYDGRVLDPADEQTRDDTYELNDLDVPAVLRVVEWGSSVDRALYLCDQDGFALQELPAGIHAPGYDFTAYILSPVFGELGTG